MCGIVGIVLKPAGIAQGLDVNSLIDGMENAIIHRGPDETGRHIDGDWGFLSRRLSIIDVAGGQQPFYSQDKRFGIVYNGETYNFQTHRGELAKAGANFRSHSDSEVVLRLFERDGVESFTKLDGMFGLCIWDNQEHACYIARDAFGMKPMYVYEDDRCIAFASEVGALLTLEGADTSLDRRAIVDYLTFRYTCSPYTMFNKIRRLAPGEYAKIRNGEVSYFRHTDLCSIEPMPEVGTFEQEAERLHDLLRDSVEARLVGEQPIALLLSGGLDSSIIAVLLHELGVNLEAFNIGFPEVNEFEFSAAVAEHCGIKVHNVVMTIDELIAGLDDVIGAIDEPIADPACFPLYRLCHDVKKHATVVLSGEGADELFSGYPQHRLTLSNNAVGSLTADAFEQYNRGSYYFLENADILLDSEGLSGWRRFRSAMSGPSPLRAITNYDLSTWLADDLMMKADKILMRHSLEGRFPFLQDDILRLAQSIPDSYRMTPEGIGKSILRKAFNHRLPKILLERPKMGFTTPTAEMLIALRDEVYDTINAVRTTEIAGILDPDAITKIADRFYAGETAGTLRLWTLFILLRWMARHESRNSQGSPAGRSNIIPLGV